MLECGTSHHMVSLSPSRPKAKASALPRGRNVVTGWSVKNTTITVAIIIIIIIVTVVTWRYARDRKVIHSGTPLARMLIRHWSP